MAVALFTTPNKNERKARILSTSKSAMNAFEASDDALFSISISTQNKTNKTKHNGHIR